MPYQLVVFAGQLAERAERVQAFGRRGCRSDLTDEATHRLAVHVRGVEPFDVVAEGGPWPIPCVGVEHGLQLGGVAGGAAGVHADGWRRWSGGARAVAGTELSARGSVKSVIGCPLQQRPRRCGLKTAAT